MKILEKLKKQRLYFDGGYGTMLQSLGLPAGELPDMWNISHPEIIAGLHYEYLRAGCDIIKTNTFGANRLRFDGKDGRPSLEQIISSAISNARTAIERERLNENSDGIGTGMRTGTGTGTEKYIALDIGPTGRLLKPLGDLDFEDAVGIFAEVVSLGVRYGADLILIETMNDSYETKAAVLAAKENSELPVFVTNAYDESGKLVTGASPSAMVAMLEGLRVDALGVNCSFGPDKMMPVILKLLSESSVPVIVNPNAGLPTVCDGKTVFASSPEDFSDTMAEIAKNGACILGGCCGTTPQHIRRLIEKTENIPFSAPLPKNKTVVSSYTHSVELGNRPILIGERINPTGKPTLKKALRENDFAYIMSEGISQQELGADILDVNVGLPEIDETEVLLRSVKELQAVTDIPLQIDTADTQAMEAAWRAYNGKPLINSVNGKQEVMEKIFPLAVKYGGVLIALTLDESGIPSDSDGRVAIAEKIIKCAAEYGIDRKDIIVDPLAMAVSADASAALVTLECIGKLKQMGIKTSLGVSNISFGLPARNIMNAAFFTMAMQQGLCAAIMNPRSADMMQAYYAFCALSGFDPQCEKYIGYVTASEKTQIAAEPAKAQSTPDLSYAIVKGMKDRAAVAADSLLQTKDALEVINAYIIPALNEIGTAFEKGTAFLPQLLMSAEAAKAAFEKVKERVSATGGQSAKKDKIVIATVKGDIHDIGKNIVRMLLENYGYDVIDLGRDVPAEVIVETAVRENVKLVGLSALMTTTVPAMEETVRLLHKELPECRTVVGGAVMTEEYANKIGADKYAKDAMETVRYAEELFEKINSEQ